MRATRDIDIAIPFTRLSLSVRVSVTRCYCVKTAGYIVEILMLADSPITLVFSELIAVNVESLEN